MTIDDVQTAVLNLRNHVEKIRIAVKDIDLDIGKMQAEIDEHVRIQAVGE